MQYIYIIIAIFITLRKEFSKIFQSKEIKALTITIVVYYIYQSQKLKEKAEKYDQAGNPVGTLARRLHNALHPYIKAKIPVLGYLDDGTNEEEVIAVGYEIGKLNKLSELGEAYYAIYSDNLNDALISDDVLQDFQTAYDQGRAGQAINKPSGSNTTQINAPSQGASIRNDNNLIIEVGKSYQVKGGVNLRDYVSPYSVKDVTKAGDIYYVQRLRKNMKIGDKFYTVADVKYQFDLGVAYVPSVFTYMIIINAFTKEVKV